MKRRIWQHKISLLRVGLLCLLVALIAFQTLSSERLVLRYSDTGYFKFYTEKDSADTPFECAKGTCCPEGMTQAMHVNMHFTEHEPELLIEQESPMLCCSELPFGGGTAQTLLPSQIERLTVACEASYDLKCEVDLYIPVFMRNRLPFPNGPPGHVDTIVLRI